MEQLKTIKELINQGDVAEAIRQLDEYLITDSTDRDEAFYLLGNAYRKQGNWQLALNNYQYALSQGRSQRGFRRLTSSVVEVTALGRNPYLTSQ